MTITKYHLKIAAIAFGVVVGGALSVELVRSNPISAFVLRAAAALLIDAVLSVFGFVAAFLIWAEIRKDSSDCLMVVLYLIGVIAFFNGVAAGFVIGLSGASMIGGALIGAIAALVTYFVVNGLNGRLIPHQTRLKQITMIVVTVLIGALAGALTARLLDYPVFR